jgi:hypothetical protein
MPPELFPNGFVLIADDVEVMRILTDHGLLDKLVPINTPGRDDNQVSVCFESAYHWCLATRHWGCEIPSDNGYLLGMAPKRTFTKEEAVHIFAEVLHNTSVRKDFMLRLFDKTEIGNQ